LWAAAFAEERVAEILCGTALFEYAVLYA